LGKREKEKETQLLKGIIEGVNPETLITICIQNSGNKLKVLNSIIAGFANLETVSREALTYKYVDKASNHSSESNYEMISIRKG
jgi:tellurite methyltransferase